MTHPARASNTDASTIGNGIESGIVLLLFALAGYGLDRWLDTSPVFTLGLFGLGAIGLFFRFKAAYTLRMQELEQERLGNTRRRADAARSGVDASEQTSTGGEAS